MHIQSSFFALAFGALAIVACDNPKQETRTEPNPAAPQIPPAPAQTVTNTNGVVPAPDPIANATNFNQVRQFADQTKLTPTAATVLTTAATVRTAPLVSDQVQVVKDGQAVTEVAHDKDYYLVLYTDPNDSTKQKAGWIFKDSLEPMAHSERAAQEGAKGMAAEHGNKLTCAAGEIKVRTDREICATSCKADSDCSKVNGFCDGAAKSLAANGTTAETHYCVTDLIAGEHHMTQNTERSPNTTK
jgi:hypothetical protein